VWEDQPATLNFVRDITIQKKAEEELRHSVEKLRKITGATIQAMAQTVEVRDPYTAGHQRRVADLARAIATRMKLSSDRVDGIRLAGVIHDIGKISVPAEILSKPGLLTPLEFSLIKTHSQVGHDILKDIEFPWDIATMVLQHHERLDGSGYPQGVTGDRILLEARILTVADVVEAMASHRPYRPSLGLDKALEEIGGKKGRFYDPDVVDACVDLFTENKFAFK
jgi:putative nucleotidyltransferase with HDIG domain